MGSPLAPGPSTDLQEAQKAGRSALSQALSGEVAPAVPTAPPAAPPPAPAPEAPSAAPAAPPVTEAPPVAAPTPQPEPAGIPPAEPAAVPTETLIDPATLTDDARRSLEMEGWQQGQPITAELFNRSLERKLEFNNRLGKRGEVLEPEPPEEVAPEPMAVDPNVIAEQVRGAIGQDQEALGWVETWKANTSKLNELGYTELGESSGGGRLAELENALKIAELRLEIPEIKDDSTGIAAADIKQQIRDLSADIRGINADADRLAQKNARLDAQYTQREEYYGAQVREGLEEKHQESLSEERITRYTEEMSRAWPESLKRVAEKHGYTPEDTQELDARARDAGYAHLSRGLGAIEDIDAFLEAQAVRLDQTMDRYHRRQSGIYAQQVSGRTPSVQPSPAVAPAQQPQADDSLDSLYRRTRVQLRQNRSV